MHNLWDFFVQIEQRYYNNYLSVNRKNEKVKYCELTHFVKCWKEYLRKNGIQNQPIILIGEFDLDWIIMFFSITCSGNIVIPIVKGENPTTNFENYIGDKVLLFEEETCKESFEKINIEKRLNYKKMNDFFANQIVPSEDLQIDLELENKDAIWITTSGTTGKRKIIRLTHKNIVTDVLHIQNIFKETFSEDDRVFSFLPINHMFQITVGMLTTMYYGAYLCDLKQNNPIQALKREKPTVFVAVPIILEKIYDFLSCQRTLELDEVKRNASIMFPKLKYIVCGAASIRKNLIIEYQRLGIEIFEGYGATECSPVISCNCKENFKIGAVGKVNTSSYCKVNIINDEIVVQGDIVSCEGNVFYSGDLGYIDDEGYLFIVGRKKEVIVMGDGNKIFPSDIENIVLENIAEVQSVCVCLTYAESKYKELLTLIIAPKELDISEPETYEYFKRAIFKINDTIPPFMRIRKIVLKDKNDTCFARFSKLKPDGIIYFEQ